MRCRTAATVASPVVDNSLPEMIDEQPDCIASTVEGKSPATIYIAIEPSQSKWVIGIHTPSANKISIYWFRLMMLMGFLP
jgi:hypothetical protein